MKATLRFDNGQTIALVNQKHVLFTRKITTKYLFNNLYHTKISDFSI